MTREEAIKIIESNCSCSDSKLREACAMFIPELKESEDEWIRKHIIKILDGLAPCHWDGNEKARCIDYLKRQKEQKLVGVEKVTHPLYVEGFETGKEVGAQAEALRHMHIEWNEEEKKVLDSIINDYEKAAKSFCGYDGKIMLLKAIRDGEYDLPKQEWSDEDKKILYEIIRNVSAYDAYTGTTYQQPERHDKKINFLRTLHPSWKPGKEQIKALEDAKMRMSLVGYGLCPLLQSLIDDLKSL